MWEVILAGAAAIKVPSLVEAAARSTGERLLGPILDHLAQPIKDRTAKRAKISQTLADTASKIISDNPEVFRDTLIHTLNRAGAKTDRVEETFIKSLQYLQEDENLPPQEAAPPSDDWLNRWSSYVEDASSEDLQLAFAKILSGEIRKKGSFSLPTLRAVSEMSATTANDFQKIWSENIDDYAVKYAKYNRGEPWKTLIRLREAGLVSYSDASIHRVPNATSWQFGPNPYLNINVNPHIISEVPIINFTQVGMEIGSILPKPDVESNLRRFAEDCPDKNGWKDAILIKSINGELNFERIWKSEP
ncbi:DUF2806 domain-containing protein [uncultured Sphingomonas sp.]|uniref:DUF2806 domain-containing protein n=1 Tax=uncultured Sphingomonas sp. TaxID=158754 RepID=UPI0025D0B069|nr:DUF2806 domain-containing protein [uncultured Sphingomonas sp.]